MTQQRIKIVEAYFVTKLVLLTQRQYRIYFGRNEVPDKKTTENLMAKFRETGNVAYVNRSQNLREPFE